MSADALTMPVPRFPEADQAWTSLMRRSYDELVERHLLSTRTAPPERLEYAWAALANDYRELACVAYAAGDPLDAVRNLLVAWSRAHLEVVKCRGTGQSGAAAPPPKEYSTGNSRSTYLAMCAALAAADRATARSLAPFVWDPPHASYVGPTSVICTTEQQTLAYALKFELLDDRGRAEEELARLTRVSEDAVGEMLMLRGIVETSPARFLDGLGRTLANHARRAAEKPNYRVAKYFLCLPALGLAALALEHHVATCEQLPADNVYLPRELIAP